MGGKRRYVGNKRKAEGCPEEKAGAKRSAVDGMLSAGMKGVLFTTGNAGGMRRCLHEAMALLREYAGLMDKGGAPPEAAEDFSKCNSGNVGDSLQADVQALRAGRADLFSASTGVKNTVFIAVPMDWDPTDLVNRILEDVKSGQRKANHLLKRILPCEVCCSAFPKQIRKAATELLQKRLSKEVIAENPSFAVVYKNRNNSSMHRQELFDCIVEPFMALSPNSKVCLTSPKLYILANVVKDICCLSIVENYSAMKSFNWTTL